jgi:catechol 2,3-dioxygenase
VSVIELGHIVLYVRNVALSRAFYGDVLGWPLVATAEIDGARALAFSAGRTHHDLLLIEAGPDAARPSTTAQRLGRYVIGIKIGNDDEDLRVMLRRIIGHRIPLVGSADHTIAHSLYVLDPDGNEVELYVDVPGTDWTNMRTILAPPRPLDL